MVASYKVSADRFVAEKPRLWSRGRYQTRGGNRMFDLHPDGKRFALAPMSQSPSTRGPETAVLVFNFLVLPAVFTFMTAVAPAGVAVMPDIGHYLSFVLMLFLAFGLCFEVPVVLVILVALGVVTPAQLAGSRRYAIVGSFVIAAVLTPPDVLSQTMLAVPMCVLYELGIVGARALMRRPAAEPTP